MWWIIQGEVGHTGVGWVIEQRGGSYRGGSCRGAVGHTGVGWGGSCRGGVGHTWVVVGCGKFH